MSIDWKILVYRVGEPLLCHLEKPATFEVSPEIVFGGKKQDCKFNLLAVQEVR
jgi:hypothetical protein